MMDKEEFRLILFKKKYSISKLSREIGVTRGTLSRWIAESTMPLWRIRQIANILGMSDEEILKVFIKKSNP